MHEIPETEGTPVATDAVESAELILIREFSTNAAYRTYHQTIEDQKGRLHTLEDGFMILAGLGVAVSGLFHRPKLLAIGAGSLLTAFGLDSLDRENRAKLARINAATEDLLVAVWQELLAVGLRPVKIHNLLCAIATESGLVLVDTRNPEEIQLRHVTFAALAQGSEGGVLPGVVVMEPGVRYGNSRLTVEECPPRH